MASSSYGIYKANYDAALNYQSERIGLGTVIRDQEGNVKVAQCIVRNSRFEPSIAEALAVVQALLLWRDLGLPRSNWKVTQKTL
jgi:hypothetical protein